MTVTVSAKILNFWSPLSQSTVFSVAQLTNAAVSVDCYRTRLGVTKKFLAAPAKVDTLRRQ
jgi:hypothetical protein